MHKIHKIVIKSASEQFLLSSGNLYISKYNTIISIFSYVYYVTYRPKIMCECYLIISFKLVCMYIILCMCIVSYEGLYCLI